MCINSASSGELVELETYKRATELYLRALWGKCFSIQQIGVDSNLHEQVSYLIDTDIFLPASISASNHKLLYYRAASTHASLHAIYRETPLEVNDYNLMQRTIIGLIEDLRVELLAIKRFPGLRQLWLRFHCLRSEYFDNAQDLLLRLSRSILDPCYEDDHQWVSKGKSLLLDSRQNLEDQDIALHAGLLLANELGQMRLPLNSGRYEQAVVYRDDNRCLWQDMMLHEQQLEAVNAINDGVVHSSRLKEAASGMQLLLAENEATSNQGYYLRRNVTATLEYRQLNDQSLMSELVYPEWDYRTQVLKQNWCTLREYKGNDGSNSRVDEIFRTHKNILARLRNIAKKMQFDKRQRIRKVEDGDEVDLDPMVNAMVSVRSLHTPDVRVFMRNDYRAGESLAVSILLDLSESTNAINSGADVSISQLMRDAVLLLGETLTIVGEQFAISGFSSNGRHEVNITNYKVFNESFEKVRNRLTNVTGQYSTRLGTAIRHCGLQLAKRPELKKILLVVTDGIPSDVDVFDQRYLEYESRHAVISLRPEGVKAFCLNLDSRADRVIEHIFGQGRYETLEHITRLPEVLSGMYIRHMRH